MYFTISLVLGDKKVTSKKKYLITLLAIILTSCGGGGSNKTPIQEPQSSNNWGEIVWGDADWG